MMLWRTTQWWHLLQNLFLIHFKHQKPQVVRILFFNFFHENFSLMKSIKILIICLYINHKHLTQVALVRTWLTDMDKGIVREILPMFFVVKRSAMSINPRPALTPERAEDLIPERNFPHELVTLQLVKICS